MLRCRQKRPTSLPSVLSMMKWKHNGADLGQIDDLHVFLCAGLRFSEARSPGPLALSLSLASSCVRCTANMYIYLCTHYTDAERLERSKRVGKRGPGVRGTLPVELHVC